MPRVTTPINKLKTASKQDIIQWLEKAQNYLSSKPATIFKVTGILLHQMAQKIILNSLNMIKKIMKRKRMKKTLLTAAVTKRTLTLFSMFLFCCLPHKLLPLGAHGKRGLQ